MSTVVIVVGLGFGDEGKGSICDHLVRHHNAKTVVRYNGGSQAAHTVVTPSGQTHTFAQFGSGTFVPGVRTHLSAHMKVDPLNMMVEERALRAVGVTDAFQRTTIDENALIITPFQKIANRLRELSRGPQRHGSCGLGVGETKADFLADHFICIANLRKPSLLRALLLDMQKYKVEQLRMQGIADTRALKQPSLVDALIEDYMTFMRTGVTIVNGRDYLSHALDDTVIFEGAQGVLLDQDVGFHPYTTWSNTTTQHAEDMLAQAGYNGMMTRLGVTRTYMTRHGPGPFVTEDKRLTDTLPDTHNYFGEWQRDFRIGWPDLVMLRYAVEANRGIDALAVTHTDRWNDLRCNDTAQVCTNYAGSGGWINRLPLPTSQSEQLALAQRLDSMRYLTAPIDSDGLTILLHLFRMTTNAPLLITSHGPTAQDKILHETI